MELLTFPENLTSNLQNTSSAWAELSPWQKSQLRDIDSQLGIQCLLTMWLSYSYDLSEGLFCNATWDDIYCWPPTPAGTVITRLCSEAFQETKPNAADKLEGKAERVCLENGTWSQGIRTNYDECANSYEQYLEKAEENKYIVVLVQHILFVGSILSLVCLSIALLIFYKFRCLWCDRLIIHAHLMLALVVRFIVLIIITEPFVLKRSSSYRDVDFVCKTVISVHLLATVCTVSWMFIQGLYLNSKLTTSVFGANTRENFTMYYVIGWGLPVILLIIYLVTMIINQHPEPCWKGYADKEEMWILLGPIIAALLVNAVFLVNILKILVEKLRRSNANSEGAQFIAAAKATLILFPVLGINNLLLLYNPGGSYEKYYVLLNSFFGSTQGIFVSIVYCFNSRDVIEAIRRSCNRMQARRAANMGRVPCSEHPLRDRRKQEETGEEPTQQQNLASINVIAESTV